MTAAPELLPLPSEVRLAIRAYARACVEANLAPLQAENERLREALEQCITSMLDSGYRADAVVIRAARAALAAYRNGGKQ